MSDTKVIRIAGEQTPAEIANKVPWDKISKCIVIYAEPEDAATVIHISGMEWKDQVWLAAELANYMAARGAVNYMEYLKQEE